MDLLNDDSDDEDMMFMNELENDAVKLEEITSKEEIDCILCCCRKDHRHDETMKFVYLYKDPADWRKPLFDLDRSKGPLIDDEDDDRIQIPDQIDKR